MKLYHVTPKRNLCKIKREGLYPNFWKIYLSDLSYINFWINILIEDNYQIAKKWAILEINISKKDLTNIEYGKNKKILQAIYNKKITSYKIKELLTKENVNKKI